MPRLKILEIMYDVSVCVKIGCAGVAQRVLVGRRFFLVRYIPLIVFCCGLPERGVAAPLEEAIRQEQRIEQNLNIEDDKNYQELTKTRKQLPNANRLPKKQKDGKAKRSSKRSAKSAQETCFDVETIVVEKATLLSTPRFWRLLQHRPRGGCIGLKDIAALIRQITSRYIDAGYITSRVYIPEQNIKQTKRLRLVVLEGKVEAIQFAKTVNGKSVNGKTVKGKTVKDKTVKGQSINNQQVEAPPPATPVRPAKLPWLFQG